ncbi:MAG: C39 family peptidase [bacterium]
MNLSAHEQVRHLLEHRLKQKQNPTVELFKRVLIGMFLVCVPVVTLFFAVFLGWNVNVFEFKAVPKSALASETGVLNLDPVYPKQASLNIPLIKQKNPSSSSLVSLLMALNFYDVKTSEDDLIGKISYAEPKIPLVDGQKVVWGNPQKGFVGNPRGIFSDSLDKATAWGVYNQPLYVLAKTFRPNSTIKNLAKTDDIKSALNHKQVPIIWTAQDDDFAKKKQIFHSDGTFEDIFKFSSSVVVGYKLEEKTNQTIFILHDPEQGRIELNEDVFYKMWQRCGNMLLVVS